MRFELRAAVAAAALFCGLSAAQAGTLIPVPTVPGSTNTTVTGINDSNVITGYYQSADGGYHGFLGTLDGQYTTFEVPNATGHTYGSRINNAGFITAETDLTNNDCPVFGCEYVRQPDGTFVEITRHGSPLGGTPGDIVGRENFVGWYAVVSNNQLYYYGYYGKGTKVRADLTLPFNTDATRPRGYNEAGTVVGYFHDETNNDYPGFILQDGVTTAVAYPDPSAYHTYFEDLGNRGLIVGYWADSQNTFTKAFLYDPQASSFSPISVSGATDVWALAINKGGVVALDVDNAPYIYCTRNKTCPLDPAKGISVPEKWIRVPAANIRTMVCHNGCMDAHGKQAAAQQVVR